MTNLVDQPVFEPGVYQFEANDLLQGGAGGLDNLPNQQLANRTAFLKAKVDEGVPDIILLKASASFSIIASVFTTLSFDSLVHNDSNLNVGLPVSTFVVPAGYSKARLSGEFTFSPNINSGNTLYSISSQHTRGGVVINEGIGSSGSKAASPLATDFLAGGFVSAIKPVLAGDVLSAAIYVSTASSSVVDSTWMQIELFI